MIKSIQGIDIVDELSLYLMTNGLKPASLVTLDPLLLDGEYNITHKENTMFIYEGSDIKLKPKHITQFREFLDKLDVAYHQNKTKTWQTYNEDEKPIQVEEILFQVGKDESSLEKLLDAKNDEAIGLALGFPLEAAKAYQTTINGELRDGNYLQISLAKTKQAGLELPTWLAYINHVPEDLDLVGGNVSKTTQALGETYQVFVRENNPALAKRVEQHFLDRRLPDQWKLNSDGIYTIRFSPVL